MPKESKRTVSVLLTALILVIHFALPTLGSAQSGRIAFLPFKANAPKDMSYLTSGIRDMLASRLASEIGLSVIDKTVVDKALTSAGTPTQAEGFLSLAKTLQADYLVVGSLTALGSSLSLDAKVFEAGKDAPHSFYATAKNESEIIQSIDSLAWDISEKVFARKRPATAQLPPQAAAVQAPPQYATAHPERAFPGRAGNSPFVYSKGINSAFDFTKSQNMKLSLQAMETADLDGDGVPEVILADQDSVHIYKRDGSRLSKVGRIGGTKSFRVHAVSIADLNGNGKPEIYVSAADHQNPKSFAFEWLDGDKANYIFKDAPWYVRVMQIPSQGTILAGQRADFDKAVAPGIFRLELSGGTVNRGSSIEVPPQVNLFDFTIADLDNDGSIEIIAIDRDDRLRVMRSAGTLLWKSDDYYGGTTRFIGGAPVMDTFELTGDEKYDRIYVPSRIIMQDVNGDGIVDVIINKNLSSSSRLFKNMKSYPSGEIHALTWNGIGLTELWRTRKIDGYIADYLLRPNAEKTGAELMVGIILSSSPLEMFSEQTASVLMYQLDFTKKTDQ
ncbi:MAG: VCBS repeat-containing protein [Desulfurivibrionaceae bacterium]